MVGNPLYLAASRGEAETVKHLLATPPRSKVLNAVYGIKAETPLLTACRHGHLEVVKLLLEQPDIQVNKATKQRATPLYIACQEGFDEIVKLLLNHPDVDINRPANEADTPLYIACQEGFEKVVAQLLQHPDIKINKADNEGTTPLYVAAEDGHVKVIELLVASSKLDINAADLKGCTPLWCAAQNGHIQVAKLLFASRTFVNTRAKSVAGKQEWNNKTAMQQAIAFGHLEVVNLIDIYEKNPVILRTRLRAQFGFHERDSAELFAAIVMLSDGYFKLNGLNNDPDHARLLRFFMLMSRLPMELQMIISNAVFDVDKRFFSRRLFDENLKMWISERII